MFNELFETEDSLTALKSRTNTPEPSHLLTQKDSAYGGSQLPGAANHVDYSGFEVVEETDVATTSTANETKSDKAKLAAIPEANQDEDEDDDEDDEEHMPDEERVLLNARRFYGEEPTEEDYYDYD